MDIRNWGQSFMTRVKQLPAQLPDALNNLPEKAQAALNDLPQTLEDGAKAVLANEQVAEGWRSVGQGVGELIGYQGDHVNISPGAKPADVPEPPTEPTGNVIHDTPVEVKPAPGGAVPAPKDPVGNVIQDAATKAKRVRRAPAPVEKPAPAVETPPATPASPAVETPPAPVAEPTAPVAEDPVARAVKNAASETKPAQVPKTVRRARTAKESTRVAEGAKTVKAGQASEVVAAAPKTGRAAEVLTDGAKVPVKVKNLAEAKPTFAKAAKDLSARAKLLRDTGNPEQAATLEDLAGRMKRAGALYKEGNTPAAFRMLHAKNKLGLANTEVQDALRMSTKAQEVTDAFGKAPVAKPFQQAADRMLERAQQLRDMGHPAEARQLSTFAGKLTKAGEQYAAGDKEAALTLFRKGMTGKTQQALQVSNKADEVFAAFGKKAKGATQAAESGATEVVSAGKQVAAETGTATKVVRASKSARSVVESGGAASEIENTGRTAKTVERVAKGAKTAKATKAVASAAQDAEVTANASKGAATAVESGATAVESGATEVATATKVAKASKSAKAVASAAQDAEVAGNAAKDVAVESAGAAKGVMGGAEGVMNGVKSFFGKIGGGIKNFFGKIGKGAGNSAGWQTIKEGFGKMLPGLGKAFRSSAIFSAVFSVAENAFLMFKGERSFRRAVGGVIADTLGGSVGGVVSALASGGAIAGLGALGLAGLPLTLAAGAIGILGYMAFDRIFRNTSIYDRLTHLFT